MCSESAVSNCVRFATIVTFILGVLGIICAVSIGNGEVFISQVQETKRAITTVTVVFSVILILLGISGAYGAFKKSSCFLLIYNIGVLIFFIAFLVVAICSFAVFKNYVNADISDVSVCRRQSWLRSLDEFASNATNYLCHEGCPCNVSQNSTWINSSLLTVNSTGANFIQQCPNFNKDFNKFGAKELAVTLELIEKQFKCAGVCKPSEYYVFNDLNSGKPASGCADKIMDVFVAYSKKIGAATTVIAVLLLLTLLASICLCCHPDRRKKEGGLYTRLQP